MSKRNKAPSPAQSVETEDKGDDQEAAPFVPPGPVDELATADEPAGEEVTDQAGETEDAEANDPAAAPKVATEDQAGDPPSEPDKPAEEAPKPKKRKAAKKKTQEKPPAADQQAPPLFDGPTCPRCKSQDTRPAPGFKPTKVTPKGEEKPITVQTGECRTCAQRFPVRVDDEPTDD